MLLVARVDRSDWRMPVRSTLPGRADRLRRLRLWPGSTSDRRMSEALDSCELSPLSSSSSKTCTGMGCRVDRRVGSCGTLRFFGRPRRRVMPSSELLSSLVDSSMSSLRRLYLEERPLLAPRLANGRVRRRREPGSSESSSSSDEEEEIATVEMSTKSPPLARVVPRRSLMSSLSALCDVSLGSSDWKRCSASGPPGISSRSSKEI